MQRGLSSQVRSIVNYMARLKLIGTHIEVKMVEDKAEIIDVWDNPIMEARYNEKKAELEQILKEEHKDG